MPGQSSFLPSQHGFAFDNCWPSQPAVVLRTPFGKVDIGDAGRGLCGGMVYAAADYWAAQASPPTGRPAQGDGLFSFIVRRLVDSWYLPSGVLQYYRWMNLPDGDTMLDLAGRAAAVNRGLAWRSIRGQWPQVKHDLDRGFPVALGVVTVASRNPKDLVFNHQVLAYGYGVVDRRVTINVYDPNRGPRDDVTIRFGTAAPANPTMFEHDLGLQRPVRGFFRTAYRPSTPPPIRA